MSEFDGPTHFLKGPAGDDVELISELPEVVCVGDLSNTQVWGYSMAGAVIAAAMSLSGALCLIPMVLKSADTQGSIAGMGIFNAFSVRRPSLHLVFVDLQCFDFQQHRKTRLCTTVQCSKAPQASLLACMVSV